MNKKFLSAILFGALTAASTSTFVSCKDYDDDIDQLQMQIDQTASTAASDLAAKVAALESQISTLNAAKEDLASQLAAAKSEAATAAANALAAANGAQASADAAAKDLSNAVARVAVLETQVSSLNSIVAELQTAKADLTAKVSDLQTQMAAVKADTKANADAIAAANAEILAKYTELSNEISKVSSSLGARIDVIDATLNTIQANYATKDELNTKAQELAAMDAQLKAQIEANLKYIETLQATVKDLASKDAELAAKIEANYNGLLEKINAITVEQTSMQKTIEALQTTVSTLNNSYSTLSSAKADITYVDNINTQLTSLINSLQQTLKDLTTSDAAQASTINTLLQNVSKLQEDVLNLQKKAETAATKDELSAAIADVQAQIKEAGVASDASLSKAIEAVEASVATNTAEIAAIKEELAKKADQSAVDELGDYVVTALADISEISLNLKAMQVQIADQKAELEGMIADAEAEAKAAAQKAVDGLDERLVDAEATLKAWAAVGGENLTNFITESKLADELESYITDEEFKNEFAAQKEALAKAIDEMTANYKTFKTETEEKIAAEIAKLEGITEALATLKTSVEALQNQMEALLKRIQSVVFIPQYQDDAKTVIVPVYNYTDAVYGFNYSSNRNDNSISKETPRVAMKFRVQPADAASILESTFKKADANNYMKLYVEKALETRAANQSIAEIESVKCSDDEPGVINVVAKIKVGSITNDFYHPATLVIGSDLYNTDVTITNEAGNEVTENKNISSKDVQLRITTEYFNLKGIEYPESQLTPTTINVPYTDINVTHNPCTETKVQIEGKDVTVANWGYTTNLKVYAGKVVTVLNGSTTTYDPAKRLYGKNNEFADFKNAALAAGFVLDANGNFCMNTTNGSAIVENVGNTMTLQLMDETFGYASNGTPNKLYEVTYKIIHPEATDTYNFGTVSRLWTSNDADQDGLTDGFTVLSQSDNDAATLHFSEGTLAIGEFKVANSKYEYIVAANEAELATALKNAIDAGQVVYTINNAVSDIVTLSVDKNAKTANLKVDFEEGTKHELKNIVAVVSTVYGDVTFKATANLTYPTDFLTHEPRWTGADQTLKFNVEAGNQVVSFVDGLVGSSMPHGYSNYTSYTETGVVEYIFEQIPAWYVNTWKVTEGVNIDANDYLTLTKTPNWTNSGLDDATDYVRLKTTVKVDGHVVASEEYGVNVTYPLDKMKITSGVQLINKDDLVNNQTVSVIENVSLSDRYGNLLFEDGILVQRTEEPTTNAGVWGITGLEYSKVKAETVSKQEVTTVSVSSDGKVSIVNPNISEDIIVTVGVKTVGYYYNQVKGEFKVTIKATMDAE